MTFDLSSSMEFHTWCVCDPLTSSWAPILLAQRLAVTYSKVPPVRIKGSKVKTRGNEAMEYGLPFTARPQYHHSVHTVVHMRKRKGEIEWQMREFKRNRSRRHEAISSWCFAEWGCSDITVSLDQVSFSHAPSQAQVWKDFSDFILDRIFLALAIISSGHDNIVLTKLIAKILLRGNTVTVKASREKYTNTQTTY